MAETIRGINIVIGTDTTGLSKALKDVNENARNISSELRQVERLLKFDPKNTELLGQKQKLLSEQVENTREKLDRLRAVQEQVNEQFQKGDITEGQYRAFQRELVKTENQLKDYEKQLKQVNLQNHEFNQRMQEMGKKLQDVGKQLTDVGKTLSTRLTAPLTALGAVSAKTAIDFESAFAGVRKTVDATEEEFAALERGIRDMAKEIPASAVEIAGVAEAAGQLGIANEYILGFTRTMIDLGESTNMSAEQAATSLARLANITQMPQSEFDRLGSTIVALGNNLATTEAEIVEMGLRLAGAGKQVGMTEAEILSLAGALSSVGIAAEAGGSAFSKVMVNMQLAAETGGEKLEQFAAIAGMSAEQFAQQFRENAAEAIIAFINGLQRTQEEGTSAIKVLDDIGITEVRMRDALLRAAGAGDLFAESIKLGTEAWEENVALATEAEQRYKTTESQLAIMRNKLQEVAITFGQILLPPLLSVIEKVGEFADRLAGLDPKLKTTIVVVGGLAAALGPVLIVLGQIVSSIGTLMPLLGTVAAFISKTLIPAITSISLPVVAVVAGVTAFAAIAVEVYRNWNETKNALINIWELIKASAKQLGLNIAISFEEMKAATLNAVNAMLEKLGVLEKLPFGIGDKFKGLKDNISNSADASAAKIAELKKAAEENGKRVSVAIEGTKVAFGDMGTAIANDVKGVIASIKGQTKAIEEEIYEQVEIVKDGQKQQSTITLDENQYRTDVTAEEEEEQTKIVEEEAEKRTQLREEFEQKWNDKLFDLTSTRLEQLEKEKQEELLKAEELGADKTAIYEYYAIKRQEILNAEFAEEQEREQKRIETLTQFEQEWANKLFQVTATNLEILEKEKQEALAKAEELGASKADILKYYALKEQEIIDARNAEAEKKRQEEAQKELEAAQEKERIRTEFEQSWTDKLFRQTATRLEILEAEKQEALAKAEELGVDKTAIIQYYANEEQRIRDEQREKEKAAEEQALAEKEARAEKERQIIQETAKAWTDSYMEMVDSLVEGSKTIGEVLKEMLISFINMKEKEVLTAHFAELAKAWAQSWWDWSAVGRALLAIAKSTAVFEGAKALVRGLKDGAVIPAGTNQLYRLGDGREDEAAIPLNDKVLGAIGAGIAANMPQQQVAVQRPVEVKLQVGVLVADKLGLKKLERQLQSIRIEEGFRLGVDNA